MRDSIARERVKRSDASAAFLRHDQHDFILQQFLARAVREQALLIECIHLLLRSREEEIGRAAILDSLLQSARAAVVEDNLDVWMLLLIRLADLVHDIGQARGRRDVEFHGALISGLRSA